MLSIASLLPLLIPQAIGVTINVASTQCIYCRILWNNVLKNSTYLVNEGCKPTTVALKSLIKEAEKGISRASLQRFYTKSAAVIKDPAARAG